MRNMEGMVDQTGSGMCDLMARDLDADVLAGIPLRMVCVKRYIRSTRSSREGCGRYGWRLMLSVPPLA
jgi:hypothetical protein